MSKISICKVLGILFILSSLVVAQTGTLSSALSALCTGIKGLVPMVAFLLIVAAGVIYAVGQLLGAETRARASVWATAMFTGAIIGILIVTIVPSVLNTIYTGTYSC